MTKTYLITPGEFNGIGLEVSLKALASIKINDSFILYTQKEYLQKHLDGLNLNINPKEIKSVEKNLQPCIYFIDSNNRPVNWFKEACKFCFQNPRETALVTGPLTKASFEDPLILGHTEYLRSQFKNSHLFMIFFGEHYNCLLLNDHIPLSKVSSQISKEKISAALAALKPLKNLSKIALLGLNPHAGENGLLGKEESNIHNEFCRKNKNVAGPISPDGFFSIEDYKKYDVIIANYHDQGLIPFKLINGFKASQATIGLPFVRTSVDHGTSKSLFMKFEADPNSMLHAIQLAQNLMETYHHA